MQIQKSPNKKVLEFAARTKAESMLLNATPPNPCMVQGEEPVLAGKSAEAAGIESIELITS